MFPAGTAGAALLVLRVSVAASLVVNGTGHWAPLPSFWILASLGVLAISLCFGLLTPYCSAVACLAQIYILWAAWGSNPFFLVISIIIGGILAVLGPGAYSIDAWIFGRRLLTVSSRKR